MLRSCFRSLAVLGGAKTDPRTAEDMSCSLGEHEVERDTVSRSVSFKQSSKSYGVSRNRERVVIPSEITRLKDLTGYLSFAGDYPIGKFKLDLLQFKNRVSSFEERGL